MKKNTIIVGVVAIVVVASGFTLLNRPEKKSETTNTSTPTQSDANMGNMSHDNQSADQSDGPEDLTSQSEVELDIKDFAYSKQNIKIKKGTKVTWTNRDSVQHTVTSDTDSAGTGLDSPLLAQGESYSFTFNETGSNPYHCTPHPNMTGTVTVVE